MKNTRPLRLLLACTLLICSIGIANAQMPADEPGNATVLKVNGTCVYNTYDNTGATRTTSVAQPAACPGWGNGVNQGKDVWFQVKVPASGQVNITTSAGTITDAVMAIYSGPNANSLTQIGCDDDSGPGNMPMLSVTGQTPGTTVWVRIWENSVGGFTSGTFEICAQTNIPNAQDCLGALPICQSVYSTTQSYSGAGNILNEINQATSCLGEGEKNDVWYTFSVQQSGNLDFSITPFTTSNDYDWAVYNITTNNCQDIFSNSAMQVSCNFSSTPGTTGTSSTSSSNSQGAFGNNRNAVIPVLKDQVYVINISNYSSTQAGYTIDFSSSTANIYDTVKPRLKVIDVLPESCGSTIAFTMSERITCATTQAGDFKIMGPTGIVHTGVSISSLDCEIGAGYDNSFELTFTPPITEQGIFTLALTSTAGNVTDLCGNVSNPNSPAITFQLDTAVVAITSTPITCKGSNNGTITVAVSNTTATPAYIWSNGATTAAITGLAAGTYTVTVTIGLCTKVLSATITEPLNGITTSMATTAENCNQKDGTATITAANTTGAVTYTWSNSQATATATNLGAGTYYVTVKDAQNCVATDTAIVSFSNGTLAVTAKGDTACGGGSGTAFVTVNGGTLPNTYLWSNGSNNDSIINAANGSYTITVTDSKGCSVTVATGIFRKPVIVLNPASATTATCGVANGSATVNPTAGGGGFAYLWSNGQTTKTATNLTQGKYYVTITDANNCTITDSVVVPQSGGPVINTVTNTAPLCYAGSNGSATASATGNIPLTYNWSNGQQTATANNITQGNYSVTVTDVNGCTATGSTIVTQPDTIAIVQNNLTNVTCFGGNNGAISTSASGGTGTLTYTWSNSQTTGNATALIAGNYTLTVKDANNCTNVRTFVIAEPSRIIANADKDTIIAAGTSTIIGAATVAVGGRAPYTYAWSPPATLNAPNTDRPTAKPSITTIYCVTVTDANSCSNSDCTNVGVAQYPVADAGADTIICKGAAIQIGGRPTATGGTPGYSYNWQPAQLLTDNTVANPSTTAISAGTTFMVIITDNFGLKDTDTVVVSLQPDIVISMQKTDALCFGSADGTANANATGGSGNYSYNWSTGVNTSSIASSLAGTYDVTVTDGTYCIANNSITIGQPTQLALQLSSTPAYCFGQATGTATAAASAGTPPYSYLWSNAQASSTATALNAGSYGVTITDANNCSVAGTVNVGENTKLELSSSSTPLSCTYNTDGTILMLATGGATPYQYELYKPNLPITTSISGEFNALDSGFYYIRVRDSNNCLTFDSATVNPASADEIIIQTTPASCYGAEYKDGTIVINATSVSNGPYTYSLNNGLQNSTGEFKGLGFGSYPVTAINSKGCRLDTIAFVDRPAPLVAAIIPDTVTLALGASAELQVVDNGTNSVYQWSPAEGLSCSDCPAPIVTVYNEQEFTVKVSDIIATGAVCATRASIVVKVEKPLPVFIPNMFSPNEDGENDIFRIYGNNIREINLRIFNRWGELVYQSYNINEGWNGDMKGTKQMPGVYVYISDIVFLDNSKVFKQGSVTLTR